jgi:L-cysteine:1D-myo-inositol 2-amino-2-deoxy-alpha-D-glucopyranoside ligase
MVRLGGEKMSKSLGNLVFVSDLVAGGTDPAAVRLALLAHHYRGDWDWTADGLSAAQRRLVIWRSAVTAARGQATAGDAAGRLLAGMRERLADDLDAPGALDAVDRWAASQPDSGGDLVRDAVDALLGVAL